MAEPTTDLKLMFAVLGAVLVAAFPAAVYAAWRRTGASETAARRAAGLALLGAGGWASLTLAAAASGRLSFESVPPTMMLAIAAMFALSLTICLSAVGARLAAGLPLALLVGVQGFRLPLELMMHRAAALDVMPPQMSYSGFNFDIVTGASALLVALLLGTGRAGTGLGRAWNWLGIALLANVITIAMLSTPVPFRLFMNEPANIWITTAPFVWLPTVMVPMAIMGHIVIFRRLRMDARRAARPATSAPPPVAAAHASRTP